MTKFKKGEFMIELVSKQNLLHNLYALDISLEDMEKVENYVNNYELCKEYNTSKDKFVVKCYKAIY